MTAQILPWPSAATRERRCIVVDHDRVFGYYRIIYPVQGAGAGTEIEYRRDVAKALERAQELADRCGWQLVDHTAGSAA